MSVTARALAEQRAEGGVRTRARDHAWALVVWGAMAVWSTVLFTVVRDGFVNFRIGRYDLGNMVQAVWSTAQGRPLETTDGQTGEQVVRLASHVDPFLVLLSPLWVIWPSPLALALAQIVVVASGALPVFWLGRLHLGSERAAALLALGYLAYPWIGTSAGSAIHPVTFAIPLCLYCIWFLDTDRLLPFAICAVLVLSTGELMGLPIAGLGLWYALARGRRRAGASIALAGALWSFLAVYVVVPQTRGGASVYYGFFERVGGSPQGVARTLVTHPGVVLGALTEVPDLAYVLWLSVPLLGLFVLSPWLAAVGLPQVLVNGLSSFPSMTDPRYHSVDAVVPFLIGATVLGVARLPRDRRALAAGAVLVCSAIVSPIVGPWPRALGMAPLGGRPAWPEAHVDALRDAVALVPPGASVSASNVAGAQVSARRTIYVAPVVRDATWAVLDAQDPWAMSADTPLLANRPEVVRRLIRRLEADDRWRAVYERDGVFVFRRVGRG